jgi:sporulation protein YlmC with PRC-barrel domain
VRDLTQRYYKREELVGKDVYDGEAKKIGSVSDVAYSQEGKVALVVEKDTIAFERILKIGDIIILKDLSGQDARESTAPFSHPSEKPVSNLRCPKCGKENEPLSKFCVKCGYKF